jgi:hypothetical protein
MLPVRSGVALALVAVAGVSVAGIASGSARHSTSRRTLTVTKTKTKTVYSRSATNAAPVAALVSLGLASFGSSITSPRGPYRARPSKITFSTSPVGGPNLAVYVDHLSWVDWGQPVAYASGIVHTRDWQQHGFIATPGGVIVDQLLSCGGHSYYTSSELFAPAGFASNSEDTSVGESEQALTPCS